MANGYPDALIVPEGIKRGRSHAERVNSICAVAEPLLGVDYDGGERAWVRRLIGRPGWLFITKDPADTVLYNKTHPHAERPRYRWEKKDDGIELGYLIKEN